MIYEEDILLIYRFNIHSKYRRAVIYLGAEYLVSPFSSPHKDKEKVYSNNRIAHRISSIYHCFGNTIPKVYEAARGRAIVEMARR